MLSNTSTCINSSIFNETRTKIMTSCEIISYFSFILYIPLLIVHFANIKKLVFISSFNFQMVLSSIFHSFTFVVKHYNKYLFRCGTKGPLNMIAILLSIGIATNISFVSFNTLWNPQLTNNPPTYVKAILSIFGIVIPIIFPLLLILIRSIIDRDTAISDVECWNEDETLQITYFVMTFVYYIICLLFLVRCIHKLRLFFMDKNEKRTEIINIVFRQLYLYLLFIFLYFGLNVYTFVQYLRERKGNACIDNYWLVFLWMGTESLQSPIFAIVFGRKTNTFKELQEIIFKICKCPKDEANKSGLDGSILKELDQTNDDMDDSNAQNIENEYDDD